MEGWLTKKGSYRFFVLKDVSLFWYADPKKEKDNPRGCVRDLRNYKLIVYPKQPKMFRLVPQAGSGKRKEYELYAQQDTQATEWYE